MNVFRWPSSLYINHVFTALQFYCGTFKLDFKLRILKDKAGDILQFLIV